MYALYEEYMQLFNALGCFLLGFLSSYCFNVFQTYSTLKPTVITITSSVHTPLVEQSAKAHSNPILSRAKKLLLKLSNIYDNHKRKEYENTVCLLKAKVPQHIIDRVPSNLLADLQKAVDKSPKEYSFAAYYAMEFLKKYSVDDEVVIDWLSNHYDIEL